MPGVFKSTTKKGDAAVLGGVGVRAGEDEHPVGRMGLAGPDFPAGYQVVVAVLHGPGLKGSEVGPRLRLAETLAPCHLTVGDGGQVFALLLRRTVLHDGRGEHPDAPVVLAGGLVVGHLLGEDGRFHVGGVLPTVLSGPGHGEPVLLDEASAHVPFEGKIVGAAVFVGALPVGGELGFQEGAEVLSEGGLLGCEGEVHGLLVYRTPSPAHTSRASARAALPDLLWEFRLVTSPIHRSLCLHIADEHGITVPIIHTTQRPKIGIVIRYVQSQTVDVTGEPSASENMEYESLMPPARPT